MQYNTTNDYENIVLNEIPLIDVRAAIEFEKGSFKTSHNIPILNNEERQIIGICYKEKGNEEAVKLGYKLISGKVKENRVNAWSKFINENPKAMIYCFRGGQRSKIAQEWISKELGREVLRLEGGYKAFRNYLIEALNPNNYNSKSIVLGGCTGSGKTILLKKLKNSIDLEGIANHRGSSFGKHISPQPTQINFENNLAYELIKLKNQDFKTLVVEDEGKNIGKSFIPLNLLEFFKNGDLVVLDVSFEERVENTLNEYVISAQKEYIDFYGEDVGLENWYNYIFSSMDKIKRKLGGDRFKIVVDELGKAYKNQLITGKYDKHEGWISKFLTNYYDPMYQYALSNDTRKIIFKGNHEEVLQYLISKSK